MSSDLIILIPAYEPDEKLVTYTRALRESGFDRIVEHFERNGLALVDERGHADQHLAFPVDFHQVRQLVKRPCRHRLLELIDNTRIVVCEVLEILPRASPELRPQLCQ